MDSLSEGDYYVAFQEKVKRTICLDNLSPHATESILRKAFEQFGIIVSIQFIPNYLESTNVSQCALVEMEESALAARVITALNQFPFMICGMPRPVRARAAELEMFDDRPRQPGREIHCVLLDQEDPGFGVAQKIKQLVRTHASEASSLLRVQLEQEERLAKEQAATLKTNYNKYEMLSKVKADGSIQGVAGRYGGRFDK